MYKAGYLTVNSPLLRKLIEGKYYLSCTDLVKCADLDKYDLSAGSIVKLIKILTRPLSSPSHDRANTIDVIHYLACLCED